MEGTREKARVTPTLKLICRGWVERRQSNLMIFLLPERISRPPFIVLLINVPSFPSRGPLDPTHLRPASAPAPATHRSIAIQHHCCPIIVLIYYF